MGVVDVVVGTYRGIAPEASASLTLMLQATNCACRDQRTGAPLHRPWECTNGKHSVRMMPPIMGSSVVHWARNQCVSQALHGQPNDGRPLADYFLLMDDDMTSESHYLSRLMSYKKDIVCGICTVRRDPPRPNIRYWSEKEARFFEPLEWDWDSQKLMEIDGAGAAYMLVRRNVFERMADAYLDCEFEIAEDMRKVRSVVDGAEYINDVREYWARKSEIRRERFKTAIENKDWRSADCWWFQFVANAVDSQIGELGEDLSFCWKAKRLGFRIFADPQVLPGHLGTYGYSIRDYKDLIEQSKRNGNYPTIELPENRVSLTPFTDATKEVAHPRGPDVITANLQS